MPNSWNVTEVPWPESPAGAARAYAGDGEVAWLDSAVDDAGASNGARHSLVCARPLAVVEQFEGRRATLRVGGRVVAEDADGWRLWRAALARMPAFPALSWGIGPGWVGYVGLEMARQLERLPARRHEDLGLPLTRVALYDRGIVLDHGKRRAFGVLARGVANVLGRSERDEEWLERWALAAVNHVPLERWAASQLHYEMSRDTYERMIGRALEYIAAGDIYQVNLAQRLRLAGVGDAWALYAAVRRSNPAPYAALLSWDGGAVASFSPEMFLQVRGGRVLTRPIKGTRPRTGRTVEDEARRRELLGSAKEAAELAMIIDLHRNDLGRVCEYGSVRVVHPRRVEAHPTVFHTVADVEGRLRTECDGLDLLRACFPAGSVTGVPKIRALEIIDELEPVARGVYTGAIGVLGFDGQMTFSVAIRTLQIRGEAATLYVGGGIVADSTSAAEYEETLAKARGILAGIAADETQAARCGRVMAES